LEGDRGALGAEGELGAGGQRPAAVAAAELGEGAGGALVDPQLRGAVVPEVDPQVGVLTAVLAAHGGADPLATCELGGGHLDLRVLIAAVALARADIARMRPRGADPPLRGDRQPAIAHRHPART